MNVANCPLCGKLYIANQRGMCPACAELEDERFEIVKQYLERNPDANIDLVSTDTGIDSTVVLRFIRSGRLVARAQAGLTCERCGRPIETGIVCAQCAKEMTREINTVTGGARARMHVLDPKRNRR